MLIKHLPDCDRRLENPRIAHYAGGKNAITGHYWHIINWSIMLQKLNLYNANILQLAQTLASIDLYCKWV